MVDPGATSIDGRRVAGADPAKREQILEGARRVFLSLGFDGASMGDIARAAGVSKGTLYVYFDSKEALFSALVADERHRSKTDFGLDAADADVVRQLQGYGRRYLAYISRPRNIELVRMVMGIAERFPRVGDEFHRDGPKRGLDYLRAYLDAQVIAGRLRIADVTLAAEQFRLLCQAGIFMELLFGVRATPTEAEIGRNVDSAADVFLTRYGMAAGSS